MLTILVFYSCIGQAKVSPLNFVKFFVYIVSTLAQLLVLCWHGDRLIEMVSLGQTVTCCWRLSLLNYYCSSYTEP